jgi:hypothetical protein
MAEELEQLAEPAWSELLRAPPKGVLIISAMLAVLGAGFVLGSAYLAFAHPQVGWLTLATGALAGPLTLYVAVHLLRLTHWAWLALVLLIGLLMLSSIWRLLVSPPPPVAPIAELALEIAALAYLLRKDVRGAFVRH